MRAASQYAAAAADSDGTALDRIAPDKLAAINSLLIRSERALTSAEGLPNRPWYQHAIYAPGEYTGYAAVVIPGVNEALDKRDAERTKQQIAALAAALNRAAKVLGSAH